MSHAAEYWERRLGEHPGLAEVGFLGFGQPFNEWMYRVRKNVFVREVSRLLPGHPGIPVLDIGSGTGFWAEVWRELGVLRPVLSDLTITATDYLREKYPESRVLQLDITAADAVHRAGEQFEVVTAMDVLFHITAEEGFSSAIANIARLLKPGGFFVFSENVPQRELPRSGTQVNRTLATYRNELERNGLRILRRVPMFVLMNTPLDVKAALVRRIWKLAMVPLQFFPQLGHLYGAGLYPAECVLTRVLKEGPSTELIISQKVQVPCISA